MLMLSFMHPPGDRDAVDHILSDAGDQAQVQASTWGRQLPGKVDLKPAKCNLKFLA